jgi:hypothetical protein
VGRGSGISIADLFIRSSAKTGVWCAITGAAVNYYYHYGFTDAICAASGVKDEKYKLWDKTERITVDDGFLVGAGIGLGVGVVSAVLLRGSPVRWWTRCIGMTNLGAFAGIAASNGYFHYTGERQKSVQALNDWKHRRNLEFHWVYWNKLLMSKLSLPAQAYVMYNGIFHAARLPDEALQNPQKYGLGLITDSSLPKKEEKKEEAKKEEEAKKDESKATNATNATTPPKAPEKPGYYRKPSDVTRWLEKLDVDEQVNHTAKLENERQEYLKEIEYLLHVIGKKRYELCHLPENTDQEERKHRDRELQLINIVYYRLRKSADQLDGQIRLEQLTLQQKKAWKSEEDAPTTWTPSTSGLDLETFEPKLCVKEFKNTTDELAKEIKNFEHKSTCKTNSAEEKERAKKDLDDGRLLLKAADKVQFELEKKVKKQEPKVEKVGAKEKTPPENMEPSKP